MKWAILLALAIVAALVSPPADAGGVPTYQVVDLGTNFQARGINDASVAYGSADGFPATVSLPKRGSPRPKLKKYGSLPGEVRGVCIRRPSTIIGFVEKQGQTRAAAFGNTTQFLPFPAPSQALAINRSGKIGGWGTIELSGGGTRQRPIVLEKGRVSWPNFTYGGMKNFFMEGAVTFINDKGILVGFALRRYYLPFALNWTRGSKEYPSWEVHGYATSVSKSFVTYDVLDEDPEPTNVGYLNRAGAPPKTGNAEGYTKLVPIGVAEKGKLDGWIVGNARTPEGTEVPFIQRVKGSVRPISELQTQVTTPGWTLTKVIALNQKGEIVGTATDTTGTEHTIMLRPR